MKRRQFSRPAGQFHGLLDHHRDRHRGHVKVFGEAIMDPGAHRRAHRQSRGSSRLGSVTFIVATMGINIVANFVSPAYDIANLYPQRINFRLGGLITSILSVLVCPWLFVSSPQAITIFVCIFGAVLGPMFGIIVADYYLVKRQQIALEDLYTLSPGGLVPLSRAAGTGGADRARRFRRSFRSAWRCSAPTASSSMSATGAG